MTTSQNYQMLSIKDTVWLGLGLALLVFAVLIVVEISLAPTYIDVRVEAEGYTFAWSQPERMTVRVESGNAWPARYFVSRLSADVCPQDGAVQSLEVGLQAWAAANNWEIVNPSVGRSCRDYPNIGEDLDMDPMDVITLKPLGWDEGREWNATLCVAIVEGDPCGQMTISSVVPSFGAMVSDQ